MTRWLVTIVGPFFLGRILKITPLGRILWSWTRNHQTLAALVWGGLMGVYMWVVILAGDRSSRGQPLQLLVVFVVMWCLIALAFKRFLRKRLAERAAKAQDE